jgi:ATP-dependent DNA ligase
MRARSLLKKTLNSLPLRSAAFIEPMECLAVSKLPEGPQWVYEIKLDGYRALGIKLNDSVRLLSRRNNSFNRQYPLIVEALADLPEDTVDLTRDGRCENATSESASSEVCFLEGARQW